MTRDLTALTYRNQQRRLRQVAQTALTSYGLADARLVLVKYEDSAVYRVTDTKDNQYALRMMVTADAENPELLSQMLWLTGLRHDTELLVPEPIPALNGALVLSLLVTGVTRAQCCLLRWVPGRPIIKDPNPEKLVLAGTIAAQLQEHARHWTPPPDFVRPHWDLDWLLSSSSVLSAPPATSVPPWHYGPVPIRFDNLSLGVLTDAVASLLRHFSYRHPQQCLGELGLPLAGDAG